MVEMWRGGVKHIVVVDGRIGRINNNNKTAGDCRVDRKRNS